MKILKPKDEILNESNITRKIERIARICYKSENLITEDSDIKMLNNLKKSNHLAMLEHANIVLNVNKSTYNSLFNLCEIINNCIVETPNTSSIDTEDINDISTYKNNKHPGNTYLHFTNYIVADAKVIKSPECIRYLVSGNIRAWYEFFNKISNIEYFDTIYVDMKEFNFKELYDIICNESKNIASVSEEVLNSKPFKLLFELNNDINNNIKVVRDMNELSFKERMVHEYMTVIFTVDRGVTHELVRMRDCSFAQESTRYCNYSKGKFNNEITVIEPCFFVDNPDKYHIWEQSMLNAENSYFDLLAAGCTPQEARDVLPTSVKSDIAVTTHLNEWYHIFNLRACDATGAAHPQMSEVMRPLLIECKEKYPFAFNNLTIPNK